MMAEKRVVMSMGFDELQMITGLIPSSISGSVNRIAMRKWQIYKTTFIICISL